MLKLSSFSFRRSCWCSSPLLYAFLPLSPSYWAHLPSPWQAWHVILYPTEFLSHPPGCPVLQHRQSWRPQAFSRKGSDLASLPTEAPAIRRTFTSIPVRSIIRGAETVPLSDLCQDTAFISLSSLLADFCHSLALCIGRPPPSSTSHILSNLSMASLMAWCLTVAG